MSDLEYGRRLRAYQADPNPETAMRVVNYQSRLTGAVPDIDKAITSEVEKRVAARPAPSCPPCPERAPCPQPAPCPPCPKTKCPAPPPCPLPPPCPVCPTALDGFKTVVFSKQFLVRGLVLGGLTYAVWNLLTKR